MLTVFPNFVYASMRTGREEIIMSIKFLENAKMLTAIVANIESCERSFQTKGLESLSVSLNKNGKDEVIVDIVSSFDVDKVLLNIQEDINLYGEDKFLPHGDNKISFILNQMKEIRETFNYMIESFQVSFNSDKEGKLIMDIACSLNASKFRKKGNEVLSSKRKEVVTDLDYEKISREVDEASEEILKKTSYSLKELQEEIKKKYSDDDFFNEIFGDKGDLK